MSQIKKNDAKTNRWRVKKGDHVVVICGKSRGHKGEILQVLRNKDRIIVSGAQMVTKHVKPSDSAPGTKKKIEMSMHRSNVMLFDKTADAPSRLGKKSVDGKLVRCFKKSNEVVV